MMMLLNVLAACLVLGVSIRILTATNKANAPDLQHLEGIDIIDSIDKQLVDVAQKAFVNAKMALVSQVRLLLLLKPGMSAISSLSLTGQLKF